MNIDFFEEYPTDRNLQKAELIDWPARIYIAAPALAEFNDATRRLRNVNNELQAAYWPTLPRSHWISPFSHPTELRRVVAELRSRTTTEPLHVLVDLELPLLAKSLFFINLPHVWRNVRLIRYLFARAREFDVELVAAEYPRPRAWMRRILQLVGVSMPMDEFPHKKAIMYYSSMIPTEGARRSMRHALERDIEQFGNAIHVALGTIATGEFGNEPILQPEELARDLEFARAAGADRAVIYRMGGLDDTYLEAISRFVASG